MEHGDPWFADSNPSPPPPDETGLGCRARGLFRARYVSASSMNRIRAHVRLLLIRVVDNTTCDIWRKTVMNSPGATWSPQADGTQRQQSPLRLSSPATFSYDEAGLAWRQVSRRYP